MNYQKRIRSSLARKGEEIRLGVAYVARGFSGCHQTSTAIHNAAFCIGALRLKQRSVTTRIVEIRPSLLVRKVARKSWRKPVVRGGRRGERKRERRG